MRTAWKQLVRVVLAVAVVVAAWWLVAWARSWTPRLTIRAPKGSVTALAFSPDGRLFAAASADGTAGVWDAATGRLRARIRVDQERRAWFLTFSPDGQTLVTGSDRGVTAWAVDTGRERFRAVGEGEDILAGLAEFAADGGTFVVDWRRVGAERFTRLDSATGRERDEGATAAWGGAYHAGYGSYSDHHLAFAPGGGGFAAVPGAAPTAEDDGTIRVWDTASGRKRGARRWDGRIHWIGFRPGGRSLAVLVDRGPSDREAQGRGAYVLEAWDFEAGAVWPLLQFPRPARGLQDIALAPDGTKAATIGSGVAPTAWGRFPFRPRSGSDNGPGLWITRRLGLRTHAWTTEVRLWDLASGRPIATAIDAHKARIQRVAFAPDGRTLATADEGGTVLLWRVPR